jgi:quercetin dioxygenase-like cupin family protein
LRKPPRVDARTPLKPGPQARKLPICFAARGLAMRGMLFCLFAVAAACPTAAVAQATTRQCGAVEEAGPACLLARKPLPALPAGAVFWHLDRFASKASADAAAVPTSVVVEAFGSVWLFTLAQAAWHSEGGEHVSTVGPLAVAPASTYAADYLRSIFLPGTTAPLHVHSGPEAFFAVSGDTCLETPAGVQVGRGPGNSLTIEAGPPMLLMAIGTVPRQGFALILHDADRPATTLTQAWQPQGLCARQLAADRSP